MVFLVLRTFKFVFFHYYSIGERRALQNNLSKGSRLVHLLIEEEKTVVNNHRGRFDIIADILDASGGGAKRTYLMYHCNLSFSQLKQYSHFLLSKGLMRVVVQNQSSSSGLFEATDKGKEFLRAYRGLKALMR
jgi:predicted transcriptional regulator